MDLLTRKEKHSACQKEYYKNHKEYYINKAREWGKKNRKLKAEKTRILRIKYPLQAWCRNASHRALKKNIIYKSPCYCGETKVEMHHEDYNKPLEIMWLCMDHHKKLHLKKYYENKKQNKNINMEIIKS